MMSDISFANPGFLYLLLLIIPILIWYIWSRKSRYATLQVSSIEFAKNAPKSYKYFLRHVLFAVRLLVFILLVVVLARPQSTNRWEKTNLEGIDIVIALDISGSMLAEDFKPNRLDAAKEDAINFIKGRQDDRIGLVVFSGESFTQCPLTTDHAVLINLMADLKSGMIEDGTAIGLGLANAVNRLKESSAKSKVVILLTDGVNNKGEVDPLTAAEIAKTFGIRVYTIGVGTMGTAPYPFQTPFGIQYQDVQVEIDEDILTQIAQMTQGVYFRATNNKKLKEVYSEIDKLEKSKIEVRQYSKKMEEFFPVLLIALLLFVVELTVRYTLMRNLP